MQAADCGLLLFLAEAGFDEALDFGDSFFCVGAFGVNRELRAFAGGEHHEAHDAFSIHAFAVLFHPDLGTVATGNFNKHSRRSCVEAIAVLDDHLAAAALSVVRAFFLREDSHLSVSAFTDHVKEFLVELLSAVFSHILELLVQRSHLYEPSDVPADANRQGDMWNFDAKDFIGFAIQTNSIHIFNLVPILQCDDEIEFFLRNDGSSAKDRGDVDDANAADLHVVSGNAIGCSDQLGTLYGTEAREVIGDEAVAALDEAKDALAFADAAGAPDEGSNAKDAHHAAVLGCRRRKIGLEQDGGGIDEFHRDHAGSHDRNFKLGGRIEQRGRDGEISGDDDAGHLAGEHHANAFLQRDGAEALQVAHLGGTKHLNALHGEIAVEARQGEAGTVDSGLADEAIESA